MAGTLRNTIENETDQTYLDEEMGPEVPELHRGKRP
jgi:hypothetical protein